MTTPRAPRSNHRTSGASGALARPAELALRVMALLLLPMPLGAEGCVVTRDDNSTLTIDNRSSYVLEEVRLAPVSSVKWGPNVIPDLLFPGEDVTVYDIPCDTYDVLVVDETGVKCPLYDFDLCFTDRTWVVSDSTLDACAFNKRDVPAPRPASPDAGVSSAAPSAPWDG